MAALWKLPVVYVIENNMYGMGTSVARAAAGGDLSRRGESFGIAGRKVDGMDVLAVRAAADEAVARARTEGPVILERSEEHTSELQSLMRISYAVFCLKKKNKTSTHT